MYVKGSFHTSFERQEMAEITVRGNAIVSTRPDLLVLSCTLKSYAAEYGDCISRLNKATDEFTKILKKIGVQKEPQTSNFSIEERWKDPYGDNRKFDGYEGSHKLESSTSIDMAIIDEVIRYVTLMESDEKPEIRFSFEIENVAAAQAEARQLAIELAKNSAEKIVKQLGIRLTKIKKIEYTLPIGLGSRSLSFEADVMCAPDSTDGARASYMPSINPEDVSTRDGVEITWECE